VLISKDKKIWFYRIVRTVFMGIIYGTLIGFVSGILATGEVDLKYMTKGAIVFGFLSIFIVAVNISKIRETP
jgi:hypothetical protein